MNWRFDLESETSGEVMRGHLDGEIKNSLGNLSMQLKI